MHALAILADPNRQKIVTLLASQGAMAAGEIGRGFHISAPAISQHLKVLKEAGLVDVEVRAQSRIYRLRPEGLSEIENWIATLRRQWEARFDRLDAFLAEEPVSDIKNKQEDKQ